MSWNSMIASASGRCSASSASSRRRAMTISAMSSRTADSIEASSRKSAISTVNRQASKTPWGSTMGGWPAVTRRARPGDRTRPGPRRVGDGEGLMTPPVRRVKRRQLGPVPDGAEPGEARAAPARSARVHRGASDQGSTSQAAGKNQSRRLVSTSAPGASARPTPPAPGRWPPALAGRQVEQPRTTGRSGA